MDAKERAGVIQRGVEALRTIEGELRRALRPATAGAEDVPLLRAIRDVMSDADRLELALECDGLDSDSVYVRDVMVLSAADPDSLSRLQELERLLAEGPTPSANPSRGEQLRALRLLLGRYQQQEFMPPAEWFGLGELSG